MQLVVIIGKDFNSLIQLLIRRSKLIGYWERMGVNGTVYELSVDLEKA
jgi:hypothetical protein